MSLKRYPLPPKRMGLPPLESSSFLSYEVVENAALGVWPVARTFIVG